MSSLAMGLISVALIFGGAVVGHLLKDLLPEHHLCPDSRETVKVGAGMVATLSALVLGLLIGSAKSSFDTVNSGITQTAAKVIHLDRTLEAYGPEAREARQLLRDAVINMLHTVWPEEKGDGNKANVLSDFTRHGGMEQVQAALQEFKPPSEIQRRQHEEALKTNSELLQARWVLLEEAKVGLPGLLLVMLLFWLTLLFVSFGLFAPRNATVMTVLFVSAVSVSGAIILILEMSTPLTGLVKVSSGPVRSALQILGHDDSPAKLLRVQPRPLH